MATPTNVPPGANPTPTPIPPMPPNPTALARVVAMFRDSPVENPDGLNGVTLHIDAGSTLSMNFNATGSEFQGGQLQSFQYVSDLDDVRTTIRGHSPWATAFEARMNLFRYGFLAFQHLTDPAYGGEAERGRHRYFIITQWRHPASAMSQASGIAHEFGHCLGLHHGGIQGEAMNGKLNYNSIMNYAYSGGLDADCNAFGPLNNSLNPNTPYPADSDDPFCIDYSRGDRLDLVENRLDETVGVCGCDHPVDWNEDGCADYVSAIRNMSGQKDPVEALVDTDDWNSLSYPLGDTYGFGPGSNESGKSDVGDETVLCPIGNLDGRE
ncbi:MAG: hypothetical protein GHCLOJNM_00934 [bacterium]|nr:hypothetical protein [bacterium]